MTPPGEADGPGGPPAGGERPGLLAVVKDVLEGLFALLVCEILLGVLLLPNLFLLPEFPWAIGTTGVAAILVWRALAGEHLPEERRLYQRRRLRAGPVALRDWAAALAGGAAGLVALRGLSLLLVGDESSLVPTDLLDLPGLFGGSSLADADGEGLALLAVSVVNLLVFIPWIEEAAFRGWIQGMLESTYGPAVGIAATAGLFGLLHLGRGTTPIFFGLGLLLGVVTWRAGSIRPAVLLHGAANLWALVPLWWNADPVFSLPLLGRAPGVTAAAAAALAALLLAWTGRRKAGTADDDGATEKL